jgi:integrase
MAGRRGDGSISFEHRGECRDPKWHRGCTGLWRGVTSEVVNGKRARVKVSAKTKAEATAKLKARIHEQRQGVRSSGTYTVNDCVEDWLAHGLDGRSERTRKLYLDGVAPLLAVIGRRPLRDLTATDVRRTLVSIAKTRSTRSVQIAHNVLTRSVQRAAAHDLVGRNVSALTERPQGQTAGRPSKAMTRDVAIRLVQAAEGDPTIGSYLILSVMTGIRPEEARALRWDHVDLGAGIIHVWRSTRAHGDVKTVKSRRTLEIAPQAVEVLRRRQTQQERDRVQARELWHETGLVFTTSIGTEMDSHNIRRSMRRLTKAAGLGESWTPRELRHTFVSLASEAGVPIEEIAALAGHSTTRTTELVDRKELRPVLRMGATVMGELLAAGQ